MKLEDSKLKGKSDSGYITKKGNARRREELKEEKAMNRSRQKGRRKIVVTVKHKLRGTVSKVSDNNDSKEVIE